MKTPTPLRVLCTALAVACALLAATARAGTPSTLYIPCSGSDNIQVLSTASVFGAAIPVTSPATPAAAAFDRAGNLYVANNHNPYSIEKYAPDGTDVGPFTTTTTGLHQPEGLAFDGAGYLYVANASNNTIERYSDAGVDQGVFVSTGLSNPVGLAFNLGNLYVVNAKSNTISEFSSTGGSSINTYTSSNLSNPFRIAFDANNNFYVTSVGTNSVEIFNSAGDQGVFASTNLNGPTGLAFDTDGTLYVSNGGGLNIQKFSPAGVDEGSIGDLPSGSVALDLALLAPGGQLEFSAINYSTSENAGSVTIIVERMNGSRGATSVTYGTTDGTATAPNDYAQTSGTLSWTDGDLSPKSFTVSVVDNGNTSGGSVNFMVALQTVSGTGTFGPPASASATVTINEDDMAPAGQIQFPSPPTFTGYEDAGSVPITVSRVGGSNGAVSVNYTTEDGTATANTDYTAISGTLFWASGDNADKTITVQLIDRQLTSGSVNFGVILSQPMGTTLGTPTMATVTINDNDMLPPAPGVLEFSPTKYSTFEDAGSATVMVSRTGGTSGATSVSYATADGTAKAGTDYSQTNGTLMWADGDGSSKNIPVTILDHGIISATPVTFNVTLSAPTGGATLGSPIPATVSITDNDAPPPNQFTVTLDFSGSTSIPIGTVLQIFADVSGPSSQVSQVQFTLDGTVIGTLPNTGGLYPQSVTFAHHGTHTVEAIVTSVQGGTSTGAATFTVYAEPTIVYNTAPPSITLGLTSPFECEFSVLDLDEQVLGVGYEVFQDGVDTKLGFDAGLTLNRNYAFNGGQNLGQLLGLGTYQFVPFIIAKDGSRIFGTATTIIVEDSSSDSASAGAEATFLAGVDDVKVPADGSLSVVVTTTSIVDSTGAAAPAVTRVDFYADGVLFASRDGNGNPIPLSTRAPAWGPITRGAPAAVGAPAAGRPTLFEATYQVPANSQQVTLTAVATTSDGLSHLTAPLHVTPVVETGTPPTVTLGPLTGGQPIPAGASFEVPVTVSAPSIPVAMVQYYLNGALVSAAVAPPYRVTVTPRKAGPYALTAVVTDTNGVATFAKPLAFKAVPTVAVAAQGNGFAIVGKKLGEVVFTRTRDTLSEPLTVHFKLAGTAKDGVDYAHIGRDVVIPAGKSGATLKIKPLDTMTGPETRGLTIGLLPAPDGSYVRGEKIKARLTLEQTE